MSEKGKCPVCGQIVNLLRDGTVGRHTGTTEFDLATDGMCSGQYSLPMVDVCHSCDGERTRPISDAVPCPRCKGTGEEPAMDLDPIQVEVRPAPASQEERIADLERAVMDLSELVRHMGQELSWTTAGQRLNNPPQFIRDCQKRLKDLHSKLNSR